MSDIAKKMTRLGGWRTVALVAVALPAVLAGCAQPAPPPPPQPVYTPAPQPAPQPYVPVVRG